MSTYKIVRSDKPSYLASNMKVKQLNHNTRLGGGTLKLPRYNLNIAREGFINRGAYIYNKLSECQRMDQNQH